MTEPLSDCILAANHELFQAMVTHRFVKDIAADRLPAAVFDRYLLIEGAFVETALEIFAHGVARASDLGDRRRLIASLDALANQQMPYFEAVLIQRGIKPDAALQAQPRVVAFNEGMLAIARHQSFSAIITAMFAAEWMYWSWCTAIGAAPISDPMLRDWVAMHAAPEFTAQANWLRKRVDTLGEDMADAERDAMARIFGQVQRLEIDFHYAPYLSP